MCIRATSRLLAAIAAVYGTLLRELGAQAVALFHGAGVERAVVLWHRDSEAAPPLQHCESCELVRCPVPQGHMLEISFVLHVRRLWLDGGSAEMRKAAPCQGCFLGFLAFQSIKKGPEHTGYTQHPRAGVYM